MIFSFLPFELKPDSREKFEQVFAHNKILEKAIQVEGCRDLYIAYPDGESDKAFVVGLWDDQSAYQRWMDHPERGAGSEDLLALVSGGFDPSAPAEHWTVFRKVSASDNVSVTSN